METKDQAEAPKAPSVLTLAYQALTEDLNSLRSNCLYFSEAWSVIAQYVKNRSCRSFPVKSLYELGLYQLCRVPLMALSLKVAQRWPEN